MIVFPIIFYMQRLILCFWIPDKSLAYKRIYSRMMTFSSFDWNHEIGKEGTTINQKIKRLTYMISSSPAT